MMKIGSRRKSDGVCVVSFGDPGWRREDQYCPGCPFYPRCSEGERRISTGEFEAKKHVLQALEELEREASSPLRKKKRWDRVVSGLADLRGELERCQILKTVTKPIGK